MTIQFNSCIKSSGFFTKIEISYWIKSEGLIMGKIYSPPGMALYLLYLIIIGISVIVIIMHWLFMGPHRKWAF